MYLNVRKIAAFFIVGVSTLAYTHEDEAKIPSQDRASEYSVASTVVLSEEHSDQMTPERFIEKFSTTVARIQVGSICFQDAHDMVVQAHALKHVLLEVMRFFDDSLGYWKIQRHQPTWYFVNKGPRSWLSDTWYGVKQSDEIAKKIATLEYHEQLYARLLGRITGLVQKIALYNESRQDALAKPEDYPWIMAFKKQCFDEWSLLQKPGHIQRNWLKYTVAGVGLALAGGYVCTHQDSLGQMVEHGKEGLKRLYNDHAAKPIQDFLDVIFNKRKESGVFSSLYTEDDSKEIFAPYNEFDNAKRNNVKYAVEQMSKMPDLNISDHVKFQIFEALDKGNFKFVAESLGKIVVDARGKKDINLLGALAGSTAFNKALGDLLLTELSLHIDANMAAIVGIVGDFADKFLIKIFKAFKSEAQRFDESLRVHTILLALIPTGLAAGATYVGVKKAVSLFKARAKDFKPLRETLATMGQLLNTYNNSRYPELPDIAVGRIAYIYAKLEHHVNALFSHEVLDSLLVDIQQFDVHGYTIQQKLTHLDLLYKKYDFLHHGAKASV